MPTRSELTEGKYRGQAEEKPAATLSDRGHSGAEPEDTRALELDQEQAQVVLAALEDAAVLRQEAIGNCPECRSADERLCTDHERSWEAAEEYDALRWHLDSSRCDNQADQGTGAVPASAPTEYFQLKEPGVSRDHSGRNGQTTAALAPGQIGQGGEPEPEEYVPPAVPNPSRSVPLEVYNAMADYAREVDRPKHGPDGEPYMALEEEAFPAEWLGGSRTGPAPTKDQITGWNDANDYWNEADDYEPDREAGE
jgi:hypothetical protein